MLVLPWLAIALAAIALPWLLYTAVTNASVYETLVPKKLWDALWPVLAGDAGPCVAALGKALPAIPAGDMLIIEKATARIVEKLGDDMERIDCYLRRWPVAGVVFLVLATTLAGAMCVAQYSWK